MPSKTPFKQRLQKWGLTFLKIAIAVVGIWWVTRSLTWNDNATIPAGMTIRQLVFVEDTPVTVVQTEPLKGGREQYRVHFPNKPVKLRVEESPDHWREFAAVIQDGAEIPGTDEKLNLDPEMELGRDQLKEDKIEGAAHGPVVHPGMRSLLQTAGSKWGYLLGAWALLVIPFFVTAIRWRNLMRPQGIEMPLGKCLQLTFVGQFYSIIMPGITGGDLVKIVYASRLTGSKTKSFITIVLDRVVGLVALMVIAGVSAGVQLFFNHQAGAATDNTLLNVFVMIVVLLGILAVGTTVYFSHRLRRLVGIEWFVEHLDSATSNAEEGRSKLEHLFRVANVLMLVGAVVAGGVLAAMLWGLHVPWAEHNALLIYIALGVLAAGALGAAGGLVLHGRLVARLGPLMGKAARAIVDVDQTLHVYRGHFGLLTWAFVISVASQLALPVSAWLCGTAVGISAPITHYLAYVPVAVLVASLPVSPPGGLGLMDSIMLHFFRATATAGQVFMLVQGVRFLPILWNLVGGYWVVTGQYSRNQTAKETEEAAVA